MTAQDPARDGGGSVEDGNRTECGVAPQADTTTNGAPSGDPASNNPASNNPASNNPASNNPASNNPASNNPAGNDQPSDSPANAPGTAAYYPTAANAPGTAAYQPTAAASAAPSNAPGNAAGSAPNGRADRSSRGDRSSQGDRSGRGSLGSRPSRRTGTARTASGPTRGQLGGGLVEVPAVPMLDPTTVLLENPEVPEDQRFCGRCGAPVGRGHDGRPGPALGCCPKDGTPFCFEPSLSAGELVAGQYEVRGCLAHGGLGWIYLAVDRNVSNRWVVLKGLLNSTDKDAINAAVAERRFLAEVNHPNIVKIYNFVRHPTTADSGGATSSYIVMEYVHGSSLKSLLNDRRLPEGRLDPMPVPHVIAYGMEVLTALGYLHAKGLAYCDFKPDNAIQYERQLKLIDLGAVIRLDDERSPVYGTLGYQAPEVAKRGPSPASDIHTVGRSLAVLALAMPPVRRGEPNPIPVEHPVLAANPSFHRALLRATDPDPLRRFNSCEEMAEQLEGVLREILSVADGTPRPAMSTQFGPPRGNVASSLLLPGDPSNTPPGDPSQDRAGDDTATADVGPGTAPAAVAAGRPDPVTAASVLPVPLVDPTDPGTALLATLGTDDPDTVARTVAAAPRSSTESRLRLARAHLDAADPVAASRVLDELATETDADWRLDWYRGLAGLVAGELDQAAAAFDVVYTTLPGEVAPKLALALTYECAGRDDGPAGAGQLYTLVGATDPGLSDAAFGRARVALRAGERDAAITALDAVPRTSSQHAAAQLASVTACLYRRSSSEVGADALRAAAARVERLNLDPATDHRVRATVLTSAVELGEQPGDTLFGLPWRDRELRMGLERCLRGGARLAGSRTERITLVDRANAVRPRTWT